MICPGATLFRNGELCEECLESGVVHSIQYGCYRGSKAATAAVVAMIQVNRLARNYSKVSKYVALTNFAATKLIEGGFPKDKIVVKSNFLNDPPEPAYEVGDYLLYIGRLSEEKGVYILLQALASISVDIPLKIAGDGPDRKRLEKYCVDNQLSVEFLGHQNKESLYQYMKLSSMIVMPSLWYEGFPIVLLEAYACGKPVVASRIGSLDELVIEGKTGRKFTPGSPQELARVIKLMMADADLLKTMGVSARSEYDDKYSKSVNIKSLMELYEGLLDNKNK